MFTRDGEETTTWVEPIHGRAGLVRALGKLDPWNFWTVPLGGPEPGDFAVVGATGTFLLFTCDLGGFLESTGRTMTVGGTKVGGFRGMRAAARELSNRLADSTVVVDVEPVLVLTMATAGSPRTVKGVRILQLSQIAHDLTNRSRTMPVSRAQRAARTLGVQLAGDHKRHFAPR
jgi:hypothetical protein